MDPARADQILIGGRERRAIVIVEYDPAWAELYATERARVAAALAQTAQRIEHVGSTSVPGLAAKPIVDVLVVVPDIDDEAAFLRELEEAGYVLRVREPGHRMVRTPALDVHVHLLGAGDPEIDRMLRFRDRLRASDALRDAYAALKRELSARDWDDMNEYAEAKGPFIERALAR